MKLFGNNSIGIKLINPSAKDIAEFEKLLHAMSHKRNEQIKEMMRKRALGNKEEK